MFDLTGRTALVTGATGGIGGAIAKALHAQGATVAISGTRREALDALAGELKERVHVLPCNLSSMEEVEALVPAAEKAMGQLDILVANAGITRDNLFVQLRDEDFDDVIRVNLTATFRLGARDQADDAQAVRTNHRDHLRGRRRGMPGRATMRHPRLA
jgi:3-oxoacyl-[acyl-carrier protein] reductase